MFEQLFELLQEGQMLNMTLMKKGAKLIVCTLPVTSTNQGKNLAPLNISGLPSEMDANFIRLIQTPLQERLDTLTNLDAFSKSTKDAASKPKNSNTDTLKVTSSNSNSAKKNKTELLFEEAEKKEKAGDRPGALAIYKEICKKDPTNVKAEKMYGELWSKMSQKSIFDESPSGNMTVETDLENQNEDIPQEPIVNNDTDKDGEELNLKEQSVAAEESNKKSFEDDFASFMQENKEIPETPVSKNDIPDGITPQEWAEFQRFKKMSAVN